MPSHKRPDIHKAGVFYTCYVLTKLGFEAIDTNDEDAHVIATKDGNTFKFNVHAKMKDEASSFHNLDLKFDYLVVLTHILEEPNVFVMKKEEVHDLLKARGPDRTDTFWLQKDEYRKNGKYWDQIQ